MAADGVHLTGLWFDGQRYCPDTAIGGSKEDASLSVFLETQRWLELYFSGSNPSFTPPLALQGTPFQLNVWQLLLQIPYGSVVTYSELALRLGCRSAQAIGGAVGHNPVSLIIPCHRVVGADGSLIGYAGGIERKRKLLELEKDFGGGVLSSI